jgi:hypothetical protein
VAAVTSLLAPIRRLRERRELGAARRAADAELVEQRLPSPRLAWRTNELVADDHRRGLAQTIVDLVHASEGRYLPSASPVNRGAVRDDADLLLRIAATLAELKRPIRPRGVLLVERLLTDGSSPLYARERAPQLRRALEDALAALDET